MFATWNPGSDHLHLLSHNASRLHATLQRLLHRWGEHSNRTTRILWLFHLCLFTLMICDRLHWESYLAVMKVFPKGILVWTRTPQTIQWIGKNYVDTEGCLLLLLSKWMRYNYRDEIARFWNVLVNTSIEVKSVIYFDTRIVQSYKHK